MHVKYDEEKLRKTLSFFKWGFMKGNTTVEIDEQGDMHFYQSGNLKVFTIENLENKKPDSVNKKTESVYTPSDPNKE